MSGWNSVTSSWITSRLGYLFRREQMRNLSFLWHSLPGQGRHFWTCSLEGPALPGQFPFSVLVSVCILSLYVFVVVLFYHLILSFVVAYFSFLLCCLVSEMVANLQPQTLCQVDCFLINRKIK